MIDKEWERQNLLDHIVPQLIYIDEGIGLSHPFNQQEWDAHVHFPIVALPRPPVVGECVLFDTDRSDPEDEVDDELYLTYIDIATGRPSEIFGYNIPLKRRLDAYKDIENGYVLDSITRCAYEEDARFVLPHIDFGYLPFTVTNRVDRIWDVDSAGRKSASEVVLRRLIYKGRSEGYLGPAPYYMIGESFLRKVTKNFLAALDLPTSKDLWLEGMRSYFLGAETITYALGEGGVLIKNGRGSEKPNWQRFHDILDDVCVRVFPKRWEK